MRSLIVAGAGLVLLLVGVGLFDWRLSVCLLGAFVLWVGRVGEFEE